MTQLYTRQAIQAFQSNLHLKCGVDQKDDYEKKNPNKYNKYYFQILIFDDEKDPGKLVYGTKEDLLKTYGLKSSYLPTSGVEVDENFIKANLSGDSIKNAQFSTVRFLLQSRRLSQILTSTWIDLDKIEESKKHQTKFIRKILDSYNIIPETYWLNEQDGFNECKDLEIQRKLLEMDIQDQTEKEDLLTHLIKPEYISYNSISLALLLSGQAYYKNEGKWTRICEPIFSTYETIWEYALDISWDTFYANRIDLSQAGGQPKPPFTKVNLGYPPRPDEFSLGQKKIEEWVTAEEHYTDNDRNPYPFYPKKGSPQWNNQELQFVAPPYPYIPLSTT